AVEEAGGPPKHRRVARQQPQLEPQGNPEPVAEPQPQPEPVHVAEPQPDHTHVAEPQPDPAPAAEEDDGKQLGEEDFQEDDDAVQAGAAGKKGEK
ncbi:hypothetical protein A2U01_0075937, partial [Trifolium medium]|nr:hypothetical protein [Trifolium medium]